MNRRDLLLRGLAAGIATFGYARAQARKVRITGLETFVVDVSPKGNWVLVRLVTNQGLTGIGEASHGMPGGDQRVAGAQRMKVLLAEFFEFVRNESPFDIEQYRRRGWNKAKSGRLAAATAFSAIEQALWDLCGKAAGLPVCDLLGGRLRSDLPIYANINRATIARTPEAFAANAIAAVKQGFRTLKAAPFDGFPKLSSAKADIDKAKETGIACVEAIRRAAGPDIEVYIDCHSFFDVPLAIEVARRLEPVRLGWYEEPVPPERTAETIAIKKGIRQRMSGGEILFGMEGFQALCEQKAVDVIMPDVKHCGGLQEARNIAAFANLHGGIEVTPHNPAGPVSTAASAHLCAGIPNFKVLEYQWGEVDWRHDLVKPSEEFQNGQIHVSDRPGFGIELNDKSIQAHSVQ
jgi:galactonate dehydratase